MPEATSDLQRRLLNPFRERQWGSDYPELTYLKDISAKRLPKNIRVHEFYLQAGKSVNSTDVQRDYVSMIYTHVPYAILDHDVNLLVQMVAKKGNQPQSRPDFGRR